MAVALGSLLVLLVTTSSAYDYIRDMGNDYAPDPTVSEETYVLPNGFFFGASTAAYQIEGGWNANGKGPSIMDDYFHKNPDLYPDNGDVACDSYHQYQTDILLIKNTLFNSYRFSLSWSRLLPNGTTSIINADGVSYYNNIINELVKNDIAPVVTLYHWDLPSALEAKGGWAGGASIQDYFVEYARFAFKTFGDRVRWWTTFNEPHSFCMISYEMDIHISYESRGVGIYQCSYNVLMAHAKAYRAYYNEFSHQGGQIGIVNDLNDCHPLRSSNKDDQDAVDRCMEFQYAMFVDPIMFGDYPKSMRDAVDANSIREGRSTSRLPVFSEQDKKVLVGSTDFLGTNHYFAMYATSADPRNLTNVTTFDGDSAVITSVDPSWKLGPHTSTSTPWAFRRILNWIKDRYNNVPIFVMENGYFGNKEEGLDDYNRIAIHSTYLRALLRAVHEDNCNIIGYMVWSLLDNLEWTFGYDRKLGIFDVDFDNPSRNRTAKKSATFLRGVARTKKVPYYGFPGSRPNNHVSNSNMIVTDPKLIIITYLFTLVMQFS